MAGGRAEEGDKNHKKSKDLHGEEGRVESRQSRSNGEREKPLALVQSIKAELMRWIRCWPVVVGLPYLIELIITLAIDKTAKPTVEKFKALGYNVILIQPSRPHASWR